MEKEKEKEKSGERMGRNDGKGVSLSDEVIKIADSVDDSIRKYRNDEQSLFYETTGAVKKAKKQEDLLRNKLAHQDSEMKQLQKQLNDSTKIVKFYQVLTGTTVQRNGFLYECTIERDCDQTQNNPSYRNSISNNNAMDDHNNNNNNNHNHNHNNNNHDNDNHDCNNNGHLEDENDNDTGNEKGDACGGMNGNLNEQVMERSDESESERRGKGKGRGRGKGQENENEKRIKFSLEYKVNVDTKDTEVTYVPISMPMPMPTSGLEFLQEEIQFDPSMAPFCFARILPKVFN